MALARPDTTVTLLGADGATGQFLVECQLSAG